MSDSSATPGLPAWVKKRDGRVVPFDTDAIGKDLFTAAESLGRADPFLTRELTDGVVHFLAAECTENTCETDWIAELVVKVVRELRQPRLAQAFQERSRPQAIKHAHDQFAAPAEVVRKSLELYSLERVFSRDLAAAHREGLLALTGLDAPRELAAAVLTPPDPFANLQAVPLLDAVLEARGGVAGWLTFDGAEYLPLEKGAPSLPRLLLPVLRAAGLTVRLHLNAAEPPAWAAPVRHGPLFTDSATAPAADPLDAAATIVQAVFSLERSRCPFAIDWHLGELDFAAGTDSARSDLLGSMVRAALGEYPVTFVFDRPRRPVSLGPGLDRLHSYLLMAVGLDLPRLLEHTGIIDDTELFLRKLASLARLAVSAGVQKRQFIRETLHESGPDRSFLQRGFLLDRARLMITPLGIDAAVNRLTNSGLLEAKAGLELGRRIVQTLFDVLAEESRQRLVDCVLDATDGLGNAAGFVPARQQLIAAGRLHAVSLAGTAMVGLAEEDRLSVDQVVRLLEFSWRQTEVARLRFQPRKPRERQPLLMG